MSTLTSFSIFPVSHHELITHNPQVHSHHNHNHLRYMSSVLLLLFCQLGQLCGRVDAGPAPEDWASGTSQFHITNDDRGDSYTAAYINISKKTQNGEWKNASSEEGRYGGGYIGSAFGVVVHVSDDQQPTDHSGCQLPFRSTRPNRQLPEPGTPWIALIKRGKCNFEVKVDNAFKSNAAGVLVYNDRDSSNLDKMKLSSENSRNISAVFTYKWKGEALASAVDDNWNDTVLVYITVAKHTSGRSASINRTSVLFVSITFIVLMIISLAWLVFYYVQRFRYIHAKDRLSRRLCNAAKKALSKIPTKTIKSDDKEINDTECCAICIEPYKTSEVLRILPCTHEFHRSCIDPWLLEHRTCPMCKMDILKHYGFAFTGSQESILHMDIEEVAGLDSVDVTHSPRRSGGISPLPQIRAVIVADHQRSYSSSLDGDDGSRSSSPNELTPSLSSSHHHTHHHPTRQRPPPHQASAGESTASAATSTTTAAVNTTAIVLPVRQDLCVSCIAAKQQAQQQQTQSSLTTQTQVHQPPSSPTSPSSSTAPAQPQCDPQQLAGGSSSNVDDSQIDIDLDVAVQNSGCDVDVSVVKHQHRDVDSDVDADSDSENTNSEASSQRVETSKLVQ